MATSAASTVDEYLAELPDERRKAIAAVRDAILRYLPEGYEETMQYGMISYIIPKSRYPETYNGQPLALASLANQKNHMAIYLNNVYSEPGSKDWFRDEYAKTGKKLDMGQSCVRFRKLENLPVQLIGRAIARTSVDDFIAGYEKGRSEARKG
jgi:uncharacterized protein YdhG (YjbR/CyaY superfamily)